MKIKSLLRRRSSPSRYSIEKELSLQTLSQFLTLLDIATAPDLQFLTMAWLAYEGLPRDELCRLKVRNIHWIKGDPSTAILDIHRQSSNGNMNAPPAQQVAVRALGQISAATLLRSYWCKMDMEDADPDSPLFPLCTPVVEDGVTFFIPTDTPVCVGTLGLWIKASLASIDARQLPPSSIDLPLEDRTWGILRAASR